MGRKSSTLVSMGISIALIVMGIWFLYNHHNAFGYGPAKWMMPHHMPMGGGTMGFIMIMVWVIAAISIVLLVTGLMSNKNKREKAAGLPDALEILKKRYASGEIDKDQFHAMRKEIE